VEKSKELDAVTPGAKDRFRVGELMKKDMPL